MEYYDLILGLIPASIVAATGILSLLGIGIMISISIGAIIALAIILHALFVKAPTSPAEPPHHSRTTSLPSAE